MNHLLGDEFEEAWSAVADELGCTWSGSHVEVGGGGGRATPDDTGGGGGSPPRCRLRSITSECLALKWSVR